MLIWLVELADHVQIFNLFRYITFRTGAALFTSALSSFCLVLESSIPCASPGKGQPIVRADGRRPISRRRHADHGG